VVAPRSGDETPVLIASGENPFEVYTAMLSGAFGDRVAPEGRKTFTHFFPAGMSNSIL